MRDDHSDSVELFVESYSTLRAWYLARCRIEWLATGLAVFTALTLVCGLGAVLYLAAFKIFGVELGP